MIKGIDDQEWWRGLKGFQDAKLLGQKARDCRNQIARRRYAERKADQEYARYLEDLDRKRVEAQEAAEREREYWYQMEILGKTRCCICGESQATDVIELGRVDEWAEMHDPKSDRDGLCHAQCGLDDGWELS